MIKTRYYTSVDITELTAKTTTEYIPIPPDPPPLRPCPCCGGSVKYMSLHSIWIVCTVCGLSTPGYTDIDVLASTWNGAVEVVGASSNAMYLEGTKHDTSVNDPVASPKAGDETPSQVISQTGTGTLGEA